jgi:RHS repeat-associated protein
LTAESQSTVDEIFAYTGKYFDEVTKLSNHLNRWLDPNLGKWVSEDPIGFAGGLANLQSYVGSAVTNVVDSNGLEIRYPDRGSAETLKRALVQNGAEHVQIFEGDSGFYVYTDPRDTDAVFKVADIYFGSVFELEPLKRIKDDPKLTDVNDARNDFIKASGILPGHEGYINDPIKNDKPISVADLNALLGREEPPDSPIVVDIGGEGRHENAININVSSKSLSGDVVNGKYNQGDPIPHLILINPGSGLPFDDDTVDHVISESSPITSDPYATELPRILKPGGEVTIRVPKEAADFISAFLERLGSSDKSQKPIDWGPLDDMVEIYGTVR